MKKSEHELPSEPVENVKSTDQRLDFILPEKRVKYAEYSPGRIPASIFDASDVNPLAYVDVREFYLDDDSKALLAPYERHSEARLPGGGLPERFTPYTKVLLALYKEGSAIWNQYVADIESEREYLNNPNAEPDSLHEDEKQVPGAEKAVYKYGAWVAPDGSIRHGRILATFTFQCAEFCRYCTRGRHVGIDEGASKEQIDAVFEFLRSNDHVNEIILSGGDPLVLPPPMFKYIIDHVVALQNEGKLDIVRIGTRLPGQNPRALLGENKEWYYEQLRRVKGLKIMFHTNHTSEIPAEVVEVFKKIQQAGGLILSQSVLLETVNADATLLYQLILKLVKLNVVPDYIFLNDTAETWGKRFNVPWKKTIEIVQQFGEHVSGMIGIVRFVADVPGGISKKVIPTQHWIGPNRDIFHDLEGNWYQVDKDGIPRPYNGPWVGLRKLAEKMPWVHQKIATRPLPKMEHR